MTKILDRLQPLGLLLLRFLLGAIFLRTGWGKFQHLDKVAAFFASLGIPAAKIQAPFVACIELVGGVALILGAGVRIFSALLIGVMAVALATAVIPGLEDKSDILTTSELLYLICFIYLVTRGGEKISIDHWIRSRKT
jgi:uncharacterized membrane protein YphA (DoxX/SURF4 family)